VLFTVAGMVPFKPYFVGDEVPPYKRAVAARSVQGRAASTTTSTMSAHEAPPVFFEMLGNFSFGDYFKNEIIPWSWEMTTELFGIDGDKL